MDIANELTKETHAVEGVNEENTSFCLGGCGLSWMLLPIWLKESQPHCMRTGFSCIHPGEEKRRIETS